MIGIHKGGKRNIKFGILLNSVMKKFNAQKNKTPNFLNLSLLNIVVPLKKQIFFQKLYQSFLDINLLLHSPPKIIINEDFWNKAIKPPLDGKSRKENCITILLYGKCGTGKSDLSRILTRNEELEELNESKLSEKLGNNCSIFNISKPNNLNIEELCYIIFGKASLKLSKFNYKKILDISNAFLKFIILKSIYVISNYKLDIKFNQDRYVFQRNLNYKIIAVYLIFLNQII